MALPSYVRTRTVSLGGAVGLENGESLSISAVVNATKGLIWNETGYRFEQVGVSTAASEGAEVRFRLPVTDQQGWRDPVTNSLIDVTAEGSYTHMYVLSAQVGSSPRISIGPFALPTGDGSDIDLDTMLPASTSVGNYVSVPDLWSKQVSEALEAARVAKESAESMVTSTDTQISGRLTDPTSATSTTLVQQYRPRRTDYVSTRDYGITSSAVDSSAKLFQMFSEASANGLQVRIEGDVRGKVNLEDMAVNIDGSNGRWIQPAGATALRVKHTLLGGTYGQVVNNISTLVIDGSGDSDDDGKWQIYNALALPSSVYAQLSPNQGDWLKVTSDNPYAGDFLVSGSQTWASEPCQVVGVGLRISQTSSVPSDVVITGATSGATGYVASNRREYGEASNTSNRVLMLNSVRGVFQDGETLLQGGVARGTVSSKFVAVNLLMLPELLTSNIRVHKYRNDLPVVINDLTIVASDDVDSDQPPSSRAPAIELRTVAGAAVDFTVESTWRQGMRMISVVDFRVRAKINKAPGYAEDAKSAWGYGIEAFGATAYGAIELVAHNVRHGFSTNVFVTSTPPTQRAANDAEVAYAAAGVAAKISVSGRFYHCTDAALDTHGGSMYITFHDFYISGSLSGGRTQARPTGVQNRSFGTIIGPGVIEDVIDGIRDISSFFPSPYSVLRSTTYIRDVIMRGIGQYGVAGTQTASSDESNGYSRTVMTNLDISFRRSPNVTGALAPNKQVGVRYKGGRVEMKNVTVRGANDCYAWFESSATGMKEVVIDGGLYDIADAPNQPFDIRLSGDVPLLSIRNRKIKVGSWTMPSLLRPSAAMSATTLITEGCGPIDRVEAQPVVSGSGGTGLTVARMRNGQVELRAEQTWDPPSLTAGSAATLNVTVPGAAFGDFVSASFSSGLQGMRMTATVTGANNVQVLLENRTAGTTDLAAGKITVKVDK